MDITPIGITNFRNMRKRFGIKDKDRLQHIYCVGKSGTGKSTLLKNMALSDINRENGLMVLDPHSDVAEELIRHMPEHRIKDLIYFNAAAVDPIAFNPLKGIHPKYHHLVASGLVNTFKKIWHQSWGVRMEHILRFVLLTLLAVPDSTLLDIQPLLTNKEQRDKALKYITDQHIADFWTNEFEKYSPAFRNEVIAPILNKVGLFSASTPLRKIVGQKTSGFRLQRVLDEGKILICNLAKGEIGEEASALLGSMLITSVQLAALHRAGQPEHTRKPFYTYIDECHNYVTHSVIDILSECRKFGLSLFLTHQYLEQLDEPIRNAIFGNIGTIICFRVGARDAEYLAQEFYPVFNQEDFINLPRYSMYLKLLIDGAASLPFSAKSLAHLNEEITH